jgi:glycine cleavage system regulatory protein
MMLNKNFTYSDIVKYIAEQGYKISSSTVRRHAKTLSASRTELHIAQENFRALLDELGKYPQLDFTEGIMRLMAARVLDSIQSVTEEQWKGLDPLKLMREATGLVRAAAYKSKVDLQIKETLDAGLEAVKSLAMETVAKDNPELYAKLCALLDAQRREDAP